MGFGKMWGSKKAELTDADKERMVAELRAAIAGLPDADHYTEDPATLPRYEKWWCVCVEWQVPAST